MPLTTEDGFLVMPETCLKSIIIGAQMPGEQLKTLREMVAKHMPTVAIREAHLSTDRYGLELRWTTGLFSSGLKLLQDVPCKILLNFPMTRDRLQGSRLWIAIPVMLAAMSDQEAPGVFELSHQVGSFHPTISSATRRIPVSSPLVTSLYKSRKLSSSSARVWPCVK